MKMYQWLLVGLGLVGALLLVQLFWMRGQAAAFDQQFIDMMVSHHEGAVAMGEIAQARAEHPEIKQMAEAILSTQTQEIDQMKAWRKEWFGSDQTPPMESDADGARHGRRSQHAQWHDNEHGGRRRELAQGSRAV
jgi:uncharacterized protein (DUF305 family)